MNTYRTAKKISLISCTILFLFAAKAEARNLSHRLGVGYTSQIAVTPDSTIPAISTKYYFGKTMAASLGVGFDTRSSNSSFGLGLKAHYNVFFEDNLIFYTGGGIALITKNGSKFQGTVFLGSEFFFAGLPSLGFSLETGIRGDNTSGSFAVRTTGDSFLTAGAHFYF